MSDIALLDAWRNGDRLSGEKLFQRHYKGVERFFINKVDSEQIGDLAQETFAACVESCNNIREPEHFRAYLLTIAYRVLCRYLRERYRNGIRIELDDISLVELGPTQITVFARAREHRLLLEGLRSIPIGYQTLLELHYWEELKTREMAAILGLSSGAVRGRLQRARGALEDAMRRIARSQKLLESTLTQLDDWASSCRSELTMMR